MADNTTLNPGAAGDSIRDIDRAGVKTQVNQIDIGGAAAELLLVAGQKTMASSAPVTMASDQPAIPASLSQYTPTIRGGLPVENDYLRKIADNQKITNALLRMIVWRLTEIGGSSCGQDLKLDEFLKENRDGYVS